MASRNFSEKTLTAEVRKRVGKAPDARTRKVMQSLVKHLHAFVREVRPTQEEWLRGLTHGIRQLSVEMSERLQQASQLADGMLETLDRAYIRFHREHHLPKMQVPRLNLGAYRTGWKP